MEKNLLWRLIVKCHNINKSVKKGIKPTKEDLFLYKQKEALLSTICERIKSQKIIEYSYSYVGGYCPYIIYFEYQGTQLSFHCDWHYNLQIKDALEWDGVRKGYMSFNDKYPGTKGLTDKSERPRTPSAVLRRLQRLA